MIVSQLIICRGKLPVITSQRSPRVNLLPLLTSGIRCPAAGKVSSIMFCVSWTVIPDGKAVNYMSIPPVTFLSVLNDWLISFPFNIFSGPIINYLTGSYWRWYQRSSFGEVLLFHHLLILSYIFPPAPINR